MRTRVKICGITREQDLRAAVEAGADAIGLVFYPPSPRCLKLDQARRLREAVPPFVSSVALFVNASRADIEKVAKEVGPSMLQFHGEETPEFCAAFGLPYLKACRVKAGIDLLKYLRPFSGEIGRAHV